LYIIAADGGLLYENNFVISRSAVQIRVLALKETPGIIQVLGVFYCSEIVAFAETVSLG
jgi:hypothetical protein